jgi:hypothetical protein
MKKLYSVILGLFCLATLVASAASVTLAWDPHCDPQVMGYRVYWSTNVTSLTTNVIPAYVDDCGTNHVQRTNTYHLPYTFSAPSIGGRTNCTITISNLVVNTTYAFAVTATNSAGLESDYSNEVTFTVPNRPLPPAVLKFP